METVPKLSQEDIMKILGDNQNFLMLLKVLVAHRDEDYIEVPFEDLQNVAPLGIRIEPQFGDNDPAAGVFPSTIRLALVMPEDKEDIVTE